MLTSVVLVPGSEVAVWKTIFQEGLRIPLGRIIGQGALNRDVLDMILLNSRTPEERLGDLQTQFAANLVGLRSVTALGERYGVEDTTTHMAAYLDFTKKRFGAAIAQHPRRRHPG